MSVDVGAEGKQPPRLTCPEGWALSTLKAVADVALGKTPGKDDYLSSGKYKIVKYRDLGDDRRINWGKYEKGFVDGNRAAKLNLRKLKEGDVVVSASAHSSEIIGRKVLFVSRLPDEFDVVYYVGEILSIRTDADAAPDLGRLLNYFFQSLDGYKSIQSKVHGVHLIASRAAEMIVPVPPKEAQTRIISKLDELFSRIEDGERALERVQKLVERYRQSVLKAAVTGELTREWREKQAKSGAPIETGEDLLARILTARREAWEQAELGKMNAKGIMPKDDKWKHKYKEPMPPKVAGLPDLPPGWVWVSVDQIASETSIGLDRGAADQNSSSKGVAYIKMNNITMDGRVLFDDLVHVEASEDEKLRYEVVAGDILFNTRNSKELVGKTGVVGNSPIGALYNNNIMRIRTVPGMSAEYVAAHMCEPHFRSRMELVKKATTSIAAIYAKDLLPLALAIPPLEEQRHLQAEIESYLSRVNQVLIDLAKQALASKALRQSTLKVAFAGSLVGQDPSDENASVLLERIAAERSTAPTNSKRGTKIKKKDTK